MASKTICLILVLFIVVAHSAQDDDDKYWERKYNIAQEEAYKAYNPDPFSVTNSFNAVSIEKKN